jgi:L-threonylcarbamoyladenylate synthase
METTGDVERAGEVLRSGGVVAYATDTLYGLAVDPCSHAAVARLFAVKDRQPGHAVPLIAADLHQAEQVAIFDHVARRLAAAFWPGPLSLVLDARPGLDEAVLADDRSIAVRVPDSAVARALASRFGGCITSTSANLSGRPPTAVPDDVARELAGRLDLLLDTGPAPGGAPSTIVDARGGSVRLVRAGAIAWDRVLRSVQ